MNLLVVDDKQVINDNNGLEKINLDIWNTGNALLKEEREKLKFGIGKS